MKDSLNKERKAYHNSRKSFPERQIPAKTYQSGPDPRKVSLDILSQHFESGTPLKSLISTVLDSSGLSGLDRRFAFNLVKGTIRYRIRFDFIISSIVAKRKLEDIDPTVLNILRMGIYQCQFMDRVPSYSIVNESVKLAKSEQEHAAGFVNAVMRKASSIKNADIFLEGLLRKRKIGQAQVLSIRYSYPEWITKYWMEHFGRDKTIKLCRYLNRTPGFYLRINRALRGGTTTGNSGLSSYMDSRKGPSGKGSAVTDEKKGNGDMSPYADLSENMSEKDRKEISGNKEKGNSRLSSDLKSIGAIPVHLMTVGLGGLESDFAEVFGPIARSVLPGGEHEVFGEAASISSAAGLEKTQLFLEGKVTVQDLSSQMAVKYFLDPRPGEKILDVCAAPGGKTAFMADIMEDNGEIVAVDISDEKLDLLRKNISRMGAGIVRAYRADASRKGFLSGDRYYGYFDRIFVDAPCSALGTISKNPEVKYNKRMEGLERLSNMALAILTACGPYLKKGGRLVFYTCTLSPVENQQTIDNFLREMEQKYIIEETGHTGPAAAPLEATGGKQAGSKNLSVKMQLEIMPYYLGSEGGFVSVLKKNN